MLAKAIEVAIHESRKSTHETYFHGAAVVRANTVIATGHNWANGIHAEVHAVGRVHPKKRQNIVVYSIRTTASGKLANAAPCWMCQIFLRSQGVRKVFYSTPDRGIKWMKL
jgi:tRNA(Arg) A34 adenosine deaminase TadA